MHLDRITARAFEFMLATGASYTFALVIARRERDIANAAPITRRCFCPDDCGCRVPWRTNFCGCREH